MKTGARMLLVALAAMLATGALAEVPQVVNYQGRITNPDGTAVTDGSYQIGFAIYDQASGGSILWNCPPQVVSVENGLFTYQLGSVSLLPNDLFAIDTVRWIGIYVSGEQITPRAKLTSVAYAYHSLRADTAATIDLPFVIEAGDDFNPLVRVRNVGDGGAIRAQSTSGHLAGNFIGDVDVTGDLNVDGVIVGEPGVVNRLPAPPSFFFLDAGLVDYTVDSIDITIPEDGYVEITAGCYVNLFHTTGTKTRIWVSISKTRDEGDWMLPGGKVVSVPEGIATDLWQIPCATTRLYEETQGTHRYYFCAEYDSGTDVQTNVAQIYIRAKFFPAAYGVIELTSPPAPGHEAADGAASGGGSHHEE